MEQRWVEEVEEYYTMKPFLEPLLFLNLHESVFAVT